MPARINNRALVGAKNIKILNVKIRDIIRGYVVKSTRSRQHCVTEEKHDLLLVFICRDTGMIQYSFTQD